MNIDTLAIIETIQNGDVKSALDQLLSVSKEITALQNQIEDVKNNLLKKVNLRSEQLDGLAVVSTPGQGTISISGTSVMGNGTFFTTDVAVGNILQCTSPFPCVVVSIESDTELTIREGGEDVNNSIYSIARNITHELLIGDFQYGGLNSDNYRGVISQGSSLQQYGRMQLPADVVNVQFVQRAVGPSMAKAINAIQRTGDTVQGTLAKYLNYLFTYVNMTWDKCKIAFTGDGNTVSFSGKGSSVTVGTPEEGSDFKYYGITSDDHHVLVRKDLKDYIGGIIPDAVDSVDFYARWDQMVPSATIGTMYSPLTTPPLDNSGDYNSLFNTTGAGLTYVGEKPYKILLNYNSISGYFTSTGDNRGASRVHTITCKKSSGGEKILAIGNDVINNNSSSIGFRLAYSTSVIIYLVKGDVIAAGYVPTQNIYPGNCTISITRLR